MHFFFFSILSKANSSINVTKVRVHDDYVRNKTSKLLDDIGNMCKRKWKVSKCQHGCRTEFKQLWHCVDLSMWLNSILIILPSHAFHRYRNCIIQRNSPNHRKLQNLPQSNSLDSKWHKLKFIVHSLSAILHIILMEYFWWQTFHHLNAAITNFFPESNCISPKINCFEVVFFYVRHTSIRVSRPRTVINARAIWLSYAERSLFNSF